MKHKTLIKVIVMILFISCGTNKELGSTKEEYIMAYKKAILYECINSATNGNLYKFSENNNDLGTAIETAVLYHHEVLKAKELGEQLSKKIRTINYSDYQGKKPIFSDCVNFAFSEEIDSIANKKYKYLKKGKLEYKSE